MPTASWTDPAQKTHLMTGSGLHGHRPQDPVQRSQSVATLTRVVGWLKDPRHASYSSSPISAGPPLSWLLPRGLSLDISCLWDCWQFPDSGLSPYSFKRPSLTIFRAHWVPALESFSPGEPEWHNLALNYISSHLAPVLQRVLIVLPRPDCKCPEGREHSPILCDTTKHKAKQTVST